MNIQDLRVGQRVQIKKRNLDSYNNGVNHKHWMPEMDRINGNIVTIRSINNGSVFIKEEQYLFDFDWLEPTDEPDMVEVICNSKKTLITEDLARSINII